MRRLILLFGKSALRDRDEEEVRGYRNALRLIHENGAKLPINEATIKKLHKLSRGEVWDAGLYKEKDVDIIQKYADGRSRVRFKTVPAKQTPGAMAEMIQLWQRGQREKWVHPLILAAALNLDFLCIHPFRDGNGRVSRLLFLLACYHCGIEAGRYVMAGYWAALFTTAANANYYLAANSPLHGVGTTNIDPGLLAEIQTMTTYAPQDGGWPDVNGTDLGYHYPTNEDSNYDGIPDWWIWQWFGNYNENGSTLDSGGISTLLYDYQSYTNGTPINPNVIQFTVRLGNQNFNVTNATGSFVVLAGWPSYEAVLVNDTNLNDAVWTNYDGIVHMSLGPTDGVYQVWFGLQGFNTNAQPVWVGTRVTLNRAIPQVFITSPVTNVVAQPYLQLQGYSALPLAGITFDISNALAFVTNQTGNIIGHTVNTNTSSYTTDYFQCYDIPLAVGTNAITLHATDPAGNITNIAINITLDYSNASNPVIQLAWPTNGMEICGSSFTLRGWTEDASATVMAQITDNNDNTSVVSGMVERTGVFWVQNLPLAEGTSVVTLWVTNAAGLLSTTTISVVKSDVTLTLDQIEGDLWLPTVNVIGTISPSGYAVTVNGVAATVSGNSWIANNVPVSSGGVASFDMKAISLGGGDPDVNDDMNKPDEVVMDSAIWGSGYEQVYQLDDQGDVETVSDAITGNYTFTGGGIYHQHDETLDPGYSVIKDLFIVLGPGGVTLDTYGYVNGVFYDDGPGRPLPIPLEEGSLSAGPEDGYASQYRNSTVTEMFFKGGSYPPGSPLLVSASANPVQELPQPWFPTMATANLPYNQVTIVGVGQEGSDDLANTVVMAGAPMVVTPTAGVPLYEFGDGVGVSAPLLSITANGITLSSDMVADGANFCVGQYVPFALSSLPAGVTATNFNWTLPPTFVNTNIPSAGSGHYTVEPAFLKLPTTWGWWVSGGQPQTYTATVTCTLVYANGDPSENVTFSGEFSMIQPVPTFSAEIVGVVAADTNYYGSSTFVMGG